MKHDLRLIPLDPDFAPLAITLDDETLAVSGPDAAIVEQMLAEAVEIGHVVIHPYPTMVEITDPQNDRAQFAAVLADRYQLPEVMEGWLPAVDDEPGGVEVLY